MELLSVEARSAKKRATCRDVEAEKNVLMEIVVPSICRVVSVTSFDHDKPGVDFVVDLVRLILDGELAVGDTDPRQYTAF